MKQTLEEYCDWLEDLTIAGDTINSKGLQKWITEYAKDYCTKQLTIPIVSGSFTKDDLKKAFNSGRTLKNYKGEWVDNELIMDDYTDGKYSNFEDWFDNYH